MTKKSILVIFVESNFNEEFSILEEELQVKLNGKKGREAVGLSMKVWNGLWGFLTAYTSLEEIPRSGLYVSHLHIDIFA